MHVQRQSQSEEKVSIGPPFPSSYGLCFTPENGTRDHAPRLTQASAKSPIGYPRCTRGASSSIVLAIKHMRPPTRAWRSQPIPTFSPLCS